jgi:hypothetical protein
MSLFERNLTVHVLVFDSYLIFTFLCLWQINVFITINLSELVPSVFSRSPVFAEVCQRIFIGPAKNLQLLSFKQFMFSLISH